MNRKTTGTGFTMIELAVVLVIMGLVGTLFYNFVFQWIGKEKTNEAARAVATADKLLLGNFLGAKKGTLAAPDTNASPVDGEDGDFLPASLGLGNDPWGNRLRYFRANANLNDALTTDINVRVYKDAARFATDHPNAPGAAPPAGPTGKANADQLVSNVAYVVLSLGPDSRKQYRQVKGSTYIDLLKPGLESANAGGAGANERFDDLATYKTLGELKEQYKATLGIGAKSSTTTTTTTASAPAGALASTPDHVEDGSITPTGSGTLLSGQSVPDGTVIDLTGPGNSLVNLTATAAGTATYTEFSILGWFKTSTATPDGDADVITIRQGTGGDKDRYTWWVGLWPTGDPVPGGWSGTVTHDNTKTAGELVFMGSSASVKPEFIVDTDAAASPGHHDGKWHFFAVVMKDMGGSVYQATLYADTISGSTRTLRTSSTTAIDWNEGPAPANPSGAKTYLGSGQATGVWNGNFKGYLDDVYVYGSALDSTAIISYYDSVKAGYSTN